MRLPWAGGNDHLTEAQNTDAIHHRYLSVLGLQKNEFKGH
jgi:hypothetical protein